jgi:hypothetical protein
MITSRLTFSVFGFALEAKEIVSLPPFWLTRGSFTMAALFTAIFIQSFWEEKTVAESL